MKNFTIFRNANKKEGDKQPEYRMSVKIGEEYIEAGGCWVKEGAKGKYFSCSLSKPYLNPEKNISTKGFHLEVEEATDPLKPVEYPKEDINPDDIPF